MQKFSEQKISVSVQRLLQNVYTEYFTSDNEPDDIKNATYNTFHVTSLNILIF
jgi:hypothetical protein